LLGGWREVMFFYGLIAILMSVLWYVVHPRDVEADSTQPRQYVPLREGLPYVLRLRRLWLIGFGAMGIRGCVVGATGYLPTYLRTIGWEATSADNALAAFYFVSLLASIPVAILSDHLGVRRGLMMLAALVMAIGVGLLSVVNGIYVWLAVIIAGVMFDAFMGILSASIMEVEGVGVAYIGTALGFAGMVRNIGGVFSPPFGNSLAAYNLQLPFIFWSAMALASFAIFSLLPSKRKNG
jgi:cyanate permease